MHLEKYKDVVYTSFIHLASALVGSMNAFITSIECVYLYSQSKLIIRIVNSVKHGGSRYLLKFA